MWGSALTPGGLRPAAFPLADLGRCIFFFAVTENFRGPRAVAAEARRNFKLRDVRPRPEARPKARPKAAPRPPRPVGPVQRVGGG